MGVPFVLHQSHPMPANVSATRPSTKTYEQPGWRSIDTTAKARHGGNVAGAANLTAAALPDTIDATTALDHAADGQPDPAVAMRAVREEAKPTDNLTFSARHDDLPCPTTCSDNDVAIQSVMNGGYQFARGLNKHHAVRLFKLRELVDTGIVDIQPINTDDNIADIFTKALPTPVIRRHLANMHAGTVVGLPDSTKPTHRRVADRGARQVPSVAAHRKAQHRDGGCPRYDPARRRPKQARAVVGVCWQPDHHLGHPLTASLARHRTLRPAACGGAS